MLTARIILCSAMPRSMAGEGGCRFDMPPYISAPISRQAAGACGLGVSSEQGLGHQVQGCYCFAISHARAGRCSVTGS